MDLAEKLLKIENIEVACFPMVKSECKPGPYDATLIEGSVALAEDLERIYEVGSENRLW